MATFAASRDEGIVNGALVWLGARLLGRVDDVVANTKRIITVNRNLGFFATGYNYLIQIIPAVLDRPALVLGPERAAHALALLATASITTVTSASDPALADQQHARLELFDDGRWTWTPLRAESRSA